MKVVNLYYPLLTPFCDNPSIFLKSADTFYRALYQFNSNLLLNSWQSDDKAKKEALTEQFKLEKQRLDKRLHRLDKVHDFFDMYEKKEKYDKRFKENLPKYVKRLKGYFIKQFIAYLRNLNIGNQKDLEKVIGQEFKNLKDFYQKHCYDIQYIITQLDFSEISDNVSIHFTTKLDELSKQLQEEANPNPTIQSKILMQLSFIQFIYFGPLFSKTVVIKNTFMELLQEDIMEEIFINQKCSYQKSKKIQNKIPII